MILVSVFRRGMWGEVHCVQGLPLLQLCALVNAYSEVMIPNQRYTHGSEVCARRLNVSSKKIRSPLRAASTKLARKTQRQELAS